MPRDPLERIVTATRTGLYESNYLKANDPKGDRAVWIKHNTLRPPGSGEGSHGEFWIALFTRGQPPVVAKREVPWAQVEVRADAIHIRAGDIELTPERAVGSLADIRWNLELSNPLPPLWHYPWDALYSGGFPRKKVLTPAPNLRFNGMIEVGTETWPVEHWVGLRGHNWAPEQPPVVGYGNCNLWDDGEERAVDAGSSRIMLGPVLSPWLTVLVSHNPTRELNRPHRWLGASTVRPESLRFATGDVELLLSARREDYAGMRYKHPDGRVSYTYNTKFADVRWQVGQESFTSRMGELEVMFDDPLEGVALHPAPDWNPQDGDYRS